MKKQKHECEYAGHTGRGKCPRPGVIPLKMNGHPLIWYCPKHASEIHDFLTHTSKWNKLSNLKPKKNRDLEREKRRHRLHQILETIQPATSGALAAYAKALGTTPRTIRDDLTFLTKKGLATSQNTPLNGGRTREWRTK